MKKFSLDTLVRKHQEAAAAAPAGRSAETFYGGHERTLRQTLIALTEGSALSEHPNPGEATVLVLRGRVRLAAGDDHWDGRAHDLLVVPEAPHSLTALEDAVVVLTVAKH
ncbi:cupin domain-containing protein [Nocardiopsis trehalosi]|jgi:quercetin dioxygenase-like cupin family protein|uniref:cupin domain-containing protein n=1 Tax=Nocardiopsis trehalosi TaxID=109329 RepID=UPI00083760DA|nr:cupin domain-containing protein [Nocardiopsis trehalosi]